MTQTNGIALVLANFSMAANCRSDPDTVDFYRPGFPLVRWEITANVIHTLIVKTLARQHPELCLVDTHPTSHRSLATQGVSYPVRTSPPVLGLSSFSLPSGP